MVFPALFSFSASSPRPVLPPLTSPWHLTGVRTSPPTTAEAGYQRFRMRYWMCDSPHPKMPPLSILPRVGPGPAWQCPVGTRPAQAPPEGPKRARPGGPAKQLGGDGPSLWGGQKICCLTSYQRQPGGVPLREAALPQSPSYPLHHALQPSFAKGNGRATPAGGAGAPCSPRPRSLEKGAVWPRPPGCAPHPPRPPPTAWELREPCGACNRPALPLRADTGAPPHTPADVPNPRLRMRAPTVPEMPSPRGLAAREAPRYASSAPSPAGDGEVGGARGAGPAHAHPLAPGPPASPTPRQCLRAAAPPQPRPGPAASRIPLSFVARRAPSPEGPPAAPTCAPPAAGCAAGVPEPGLLGSRPGRRGGRNAAAPPRAPLPTGRSPSRRRGSELALRARATLRGRSRVRAAAAGRRAARTEQPRPPPARPAAEPSRAEPSGSGASGPAPGGNKRGRRWGGRGRAGPGAAGVGRAFTWSRVSLAAAPRRKRAGGRKTLQRTLSSARGNQSVVGHLGCPRSRLGGGHLLAPKSC